MAQYLLASVLVHTPPSGSDFSTNDVVEIFWDDTGNPLTEGIVVELNGSPWSGSSGAYFGDLNTNYYVSGITSYQVQYAIAGYSFCNGTTLNWFRMVTEYPAFPYMTRRQTPNSPVCDVGGGVVCDIQFSGPVVVINTTSLTAPDGQLKSLATSSNGTIKYGLSDFDYATEGQLSGNFTGLGTGEYTIYAKDANDCTVQKTVIIYYTPATSEHYRATWDVLGTGEGTPHTERVRIFEREYVGAVVEIHFGDETPFHLNKPKQGEVNDKFFPIHPTSASLTIFATQLYQYYGLSSQDDKKYHTIYEVEEDTTFVEKWQGFIVPAVWKETLLPGIPRAIEIQITDNVKTLESLSFTDDNKNLLTGRMQLIKVIALIMKKTGLLLKFRCGVNIFEVNHTQESDGSSDPFDQTYIDATCYRDGIDPFNCWDVLEKLLRPFGARILQCENQWLIEEIDRATDEYAYRIFDENGDYESNSTADEVMDIKNPSETNRAALLGRDHSQEVIPAYGSIKLTSKFNYVGSIVTGGFEKENLLSPDAEINIISQGIFYSEEGFKDWTLRLNGTKGVSFGRVLLSNRGDSSRTGLKTDVGADLSKSVGAFFYDPLNWNGNLRDAYIESAAKPYQYGPNDYLKIYFKHSTPARPEYEFMVLRIVIKVGNQYLQPDLTWDTAEAIYRAYPPISNSMQEFELTIPVPETDVIVDATIQTRIYFYASGFYDYGLPSRTRDPADGTDGVAGLKALATDGLRQVGLDYRVDIRREISIGPAPIHAYFREFYELRVWDVAEDLDNGIIHPDDFDSDTNPCVWKGLKTIIIKSDEINLLRRGADLKFYIDDVAVDSLVNGQPPPADETLTLKISDFLNEDLPVELYNFDCPDITNAKNMYNNYFQLEDGSPTGEWFRSGINERLKIQEILLKVLGANYSAPSTRITGSFINEFEQIKFSNYLRITEAGAPLVMSNTEFTSNIDDWDGDGSGEPFSWTASSDGCAEVHLAGEEDSEKFSQAITPCEGHIQVSTTIHLAPGIGNDREDQLWLLFYKDGEIVQTEKMFTFLAPQSADDYNLTFKVFLPIDIDAIGFYFKRVSGSDTCLYQVSQFKPEGIDIEKIYQITDYQYDTRKQLGFFELMQMSKGYISLAGVDMGGNGQSGSGEGNDFNGDFNEDFGADFDTILN